MVKMGEIGRLFFIRHLAMPRGLHAGRWALLHISSCFSYYTKVTASDKRLHVDRTLLIA